MLPLLKDTRSGRVEISEEKVFQKDFDSVVIRVNMKLYVMSNCKISFYKYKIFHFFRFGNPYSEMNKHSNVRISMLSDGIMSI